MNNVNRILSRPAAPDLRQMVEPLANYICANDQPKAALQSVLAAVLNEVRETNRAARAQFGIYSENCCS